MRNGLKQPDLSLEELNIADGFVKHRSGVHFGSPGDESLEDADFLADPLSPVACSHALRVVADANVSSLRFTDGGGVDVHRLHSSYLVHHLLHGSQLFFRLLLFFHALNTQYVSEEPRGGGGGWCYNGRGCRGGCLMHLKKVGVMSVGVVVGPNPRSKRVLDLENNMVMMLLLLWFVRFHLFKIPSGVHICECSCGGVLVGVHVDQIDRYEKYGMGLAASDRCGVV